MKKNFFYVLVVSLAITVLGCDIVEVGAPAINCIFDNDCRITVSDSTDTITLSGMGGSGFLQSRTFPVGEPGTAAEGLYGYQYRIDLRQMYGLTHINCIKEFTIEFGPLSFLDYNVDGDIDAVYVVTSGGLGNVKPDSFQVSDNKITFYFDSGVCPGAYPGGGDSTFFFGLSSAYPAQYVQASVKDGNGGNYTLDARAPNFP